ncbi:MAG: hypothetical protein ACREPH_09105, partial [Rhodanobacteraceae bacterium]
CGVMHLASASGAPTLGLFSVTEALKYAPYGHGSLALDTRGKSPEDIVQAAGALIESFVADRTSASRNVPSSASNHDSLAW